jgi:CheY-like chemotaxis protein
MASLKLLVVEDDLASLELMTEVFTSLKAVVRPINDSEKAADLVDQEKFDGIFLDLEMPKMNGFELAQLIRRSPWNKSVPIVIVTGRDDRRTMQEIFAIGATFYLQKPVDRQRLSGLFRTVRGSLLENRRRYARIPLHVSAVCSIGARRLKGVTWNLSSGGIQVEVGGLQPGNQVEISFQLPGSGVEIKANGAVVWAKEQREGIQFAKISAPARQAIHEFIIEAEKVE